MHNPTMTQNATQKPDRQQLVDTLGAGALAERPHLFSDTCVHLPVAELTKLAAFVQAVTALVALPSYQSAVSELQGSSIVPLPPGVCLAFDFHVGGISPQLIEINTNAGGSLLVTELERAWGNVAAADLAEAALGQMFSDEWATWQSGRPLQTIAIVDEMPEQQYLYPEFVRWQKLFETQGVRTVICAPEQLRCDTAGRLWHGDMAIDLLYNRLTDFALTSDACAAIHGAWQRQIAGATAGTLITPHPQAHALWADKRNLGILSDPEQLRRLGLDAPAITAITACVPRTVPVVPAQSEQFWAARKNLFFKPQAGFGSRATYRGDKLTKRVFEEIMQGGYVAQDFVPPPEVSLASPETGTPISLKYDLRVYAYNGQIQLLAARLYQGQTTNFRTPGGGFAPVCVVSA